MNCQGQIFLLFRVSDISPESSSAKVIMTWTLTKRGHKISLLFRVYWPCGSWEGAEAPELLSSTGKSEGNIVLRRRTRSLRRSASDLHSQRSCAREKKASLSSNNPTVPRKALEGRHWPDAGCCRGCITPCLVDGVPQEPSSSPWQVTFSVTTRKG